MQEWSINEWPVLRRSTVNSWSWNVNWMVYFTLFLFLFRYWNERGNVKSHIHDCMIGNNPFSTVEINYVRLWKFYVPHVKLAKGKSDWKIFPPTFCSGKWARLPNIWFYKKEGRVDTNRTSPSSQTSSSQSQVRAKPTAGGWGDKDLQGQYLPCQRWAITPQGFMWWIYLRSANLHTGSQKVSCLRFHRFTTACGTNFTSSTCGFQEVAHVKSWTGLNPTYLH